MRILVHGPSLRPGDRRMHWSAAGLALRGHLVWWSGASADAARDAGLPAEVVRTSRGLALSQVHADIILGGSGSLHLIALAGWHAGARCMVIGIEVEMLRGWGPLDRWAWDSLYSAGLVEEADAESLGRDARGLDAGRLALWTAAEAPTRSAAAHPDTEILERACERALARHRGRSPRPAVFLDRDGTLVVEQGYLSDPADIELLPGVPQALQNLRSAGFALVVISNQSGVGRGLFPLERAHEAMAQLRRKLRTHAVELDAIYFCPHHPEMGCACRKPGPALLVRAAEDLVLDLRRSVMIGDKRLDAAAGRAAGARGVLVRTGYGGEEAALPHDRDVREEPDHVSEDLAAAAAWVLEREGGAGD